MNGGNHGHSGLNDLLSYPFISCLEERRTRRVARGTSIDAGPLSHTSTNRPAPLSPLEEAILVVCTGATGVTTHDGPLEKPNGGRELGTPFLNIIARAASSADDCQATSFFLINDDGVFLLRQPEGRDALDAMKSLPPRWSRLEGAGLGCSGRRRPGSRLRPSRRVSSRIPLLPRMEPARRFPKAAWRNGPAGLPELVGLIVHHLGSSAAGGSSPASFQCV